MQFDILKIMCKNNLMSSDNKKLNKFIENTAKLEIIKIKSDFTIIGEIPPFVEIVDKDYDINISYKNDYENLCLVPKILTLGIGCRKNKSFVDIENFFIDIIKKNNISKLAFNKICSIDIKKDEVGLLSFSEKYDIPFCTYSAEILSKAKGDYVSSDFVKLITGVDNVCERSAKIGSDGKIILHKTSFDGMTIAIGMSEFAIKF